MLYFLFLVKIRSVDILGVARELLFKRFAYLRSHNVNE